ncbi:Uncharacterised protein [Salmonella enterica subsp. enterica serovar Bovismorbificans]|nr:Uncharacterised protein [Salmonella enterica subsp. enterica serovar Bovismorbificans]
MAKYQLRKICPNSRGEYRYLSCDEFSTFSDLRDEINARRDIWFGGGFNVLDSEGNVIFDNPAARFCIGTFGKNFTLRQVTENYGE